MIVFLIPIVIMLVVYFFMLIENQWRCSYCGKFFFRSNSWHRRGMFGHPENIVNECNGCHNKESRNKKGWAKVEDKSDGPSSWTEYTDHDGYVYIMYDMMINPGFSGTHMFYDKSEIKSECKHEMVSTEYSSQSYGHCEECGKTVFRDENNNWKL
jgi:hypothetical protein